MPSKLRIEIFCIDLDYDNRVILRISRRLMISLKNIFFSSRYYDSYSALSKKPGLFVFFYFGFYKLLTSPIRFHEHLRWFRGNRRAIFPSAISSLNLPRIEIAINAVRKDFPLLPNVIAKAVKNSINPISSIVVAVPTAQIEECKIYFNKIKTELDVLIVSEDEFFDEDFRTKLKSKMGWRYGWALQQFLTVERVLKSNAAGVLQVNADTLINRPQIWLDSEGKQFLMESLEFHRPYYDFLGKIGLEFPRNFPTFITHHMLFQPKIFREILKNLEIKDSNDLLDLILEFADFENISPFCIEFELYARGALKYHSENFEIIKFANVSIDRSEIIGDELDFKLIAPDYLNNFNSVSLHSYL